MTKRTRTVSPQAESAAQELADQAMEEADIESATALAREALTLDPCCVDALLVRAEGERHTRSKQLSTLAKAVAAGEAKLGKNFRDDFAGSFWGALETRPCMRALQALGVALLEVQQPEQAIIHFEALLHLNPNDNQGIRDLLVGAYLEVGRIGDARNLLHRYRTDAGAVHALAKAIERFLAGSKSQARGYLWQAFKRNCHLRNLLLFPNRLAPLPDCYSFGSREEAVLALALLGSVIAMHPALQQWLGREAEREPAASPASRDTSPHVN